MESIGKVVEHVTVNTTAWADFRGLQDRNTLHQMLHVEVDASAASTAWTYEIGETIRVGHHEYIENLHTPLWNVTHIVVSFIVSCLSKITIVGKLAADGSRPVISGGGRRILR